MKLRVFTVIAIIASTFILLFSSEVDVPNSGISEVTQKELNRQYPGEYFYNQRAYPNNYINEEAIKKAEIQAKDILSSRNESGGAWEFIGPLNTGGRITDIVISPDDDDIFYVGTASGGIFKTVDRGSSWTPVFDDIAKASIGDLAIAPSNSQIIYAGTGEANASSNTGAFFGDGIYRSSDAGSTWNSIGLEESHHIGRIVVDPTDEDRVFVAATGKLYGYNSERGVYRTVDAGNTWDQVLFETDSTAAIDIAINTQNPDILFAAMWERSRKPWQRSYAGVTSGVHRSLDGGDTWTELGAANGLPAPSTQTGRISIAISESDPSTIYARYTTNPITNVFNGLYKSTDNGDNWTLVTLNEISFIDATFGWFFGNIRIHPTNPQQVYVLGQVLYRTNNSGGDWSEINGMHVDHHAMAISRNNTNMILAGNDGGLYISENGGDSFDKFTNLPLTQFYNIEVDNLQPERLYGGTQDNNTIRTLTGGANDWNAIIGGDGFHVLVDPTDNDFVYGESQFGNLRRSTDGGFTFQNGTNGISGGDRNNWNTPVALSPFNSEIMYYGTNRLYTSNRAVSWSVISPDLTDGQHPSGSGSYGTLTAISSSSYNLNTIYVGSDDGNVNVTFDGGITWENISDGLPKRYITSLAVSPDDDLIAYVTLSGYTTLDYTPHVFKTEDGGQTWEDISGNLPSIPVNDLVLHPSHDLLFAATDLNVWYSQNDGGSWTILGDNLPLTLTRDIKIHTPSNTLYAGTYGRSMYRYDLDTLILSSADFNSEEIKLNLYPNPATSEITLQHRMVGQGSIGLFDVMGKQINSIFSGDLGTISTTTFSVTHLPSGIYFVKIGTANGTHTKKLIIQ
ncbi:MAG: T9SS type A sorting domain-containing protein [Bacteroidota bacterium]